MGVGARTRLIWLGIGTVGGSCECGSNVQKVCGKTQASQFCVCHLCCVNFHALIYDEFLPPSTGKDGIYVAQPNIPHSPCKKEI
jgi:hypothetical protein